MSTPGFCWWISLKLVADALLGCASPIVTLPIRATVVLVMPPLPALSPVTSPAAKASAIMPRVTKVMTSPIFELVIRRKKPSMRVEIREVAACGFRDAARWHQAPSAAIDRSSVIVVAQGEGHAS